MPRSLFVRVTHVNQGRCLMLLLSRKCGEKIVIPQLNITVTVLEIRGDRIRLGITAPLNVSVHREEIWELRNASKKPAAGEPTVVEALF
jgi:carbon storage regulator